MRIPRHIGIIPDGNRRWAKGRGMEKAEGYDYGLQPGLKLLRDLQAYGVEEITYYGFTADNCKRPREQFLAFRQACVDAVRLIEKEEDVSLLVVGNTRSECFPTELLQYTVRKSPCEEKGKIRVNFLVNYGWEWDLMTGASQDISRIDLIIRWGGMCRLSGFLPRQSVYADICVLADLWPDYCKEHIEKALTWYQKQDVTLGG